MRKSISQIVAELDQLQMQGVSLTYRQKQQIARNENVIKGKMSVQDAYMEDVSRRTQPVFKTVPEQNNALVKLKSGGSLPKMQDAGALMVQPDPVDEPAPEVVVDPVKPSVEEYRNSLQSNYKNILANNYKTPYIKGVTEGGMNCINGVCSLIKKAGAKEFTRGTYTGNATFNDNLENEGYYTIDPTKEAFEIGDVIQYSRRKGHWKSRFEGKTTPLTENELYPNHAKIITDKYIDEEGETRYVVAHNFGKEKLTSKNYSESELLSHTKGYQDFQGLLVQRYGPDVVAKNIEERKAREKIFQGQNAFAKEYNVPVTNISFSKPMQTVEGETYNKRVNKDLGQIYTQNYDKLARMSDVPKSTFDTMLALQAGIQHMESGKGGLRAAAKSAITTATPFLLDEARQIMSDSGASTWVDVYWKNNAENVKDKFKTKQEFKNHLNRNNKLSPAAAEWAYYNSEPSKGAFQQKELSKRGRFLNIDPNLESYEDQAIASLALMIDNYHKVKKQYPEATEEELLDLSTLMHNAPSKALTPEFYRYFVKNKDVNYVNEVKQYVPTINIDQAQTRELPQEEIDSMKSFIDGLSDAGPQMRYGGSLPDLPKYQVGGEGELSNEEAIEAMFEMMRQQQETGDSSIPAVFKNYVLSPREERKLARIEKRRSKKQPLNMNYPNTRGGMYRNVRFLETGGYLPKYQNGTRTLNSPYFRETDFFTDEEKKDMIRSGQRPPFNPGSIDFNTKPSESFTKEDWDRMHKDERSRLEKFLGTETYNELKDRPEFKGENVVEIFDGLGSSSWNDALQAHDQWHKSGRTYPTFDEGVEMFGAVPMIGKAKRPFSLAKGAKGNIIKTAKKIRTVADNVQKVLNVSDAGKDIIREDLPLIESIQPTKPGTLSKEVKKSLPKYQVGTNSFPQATDKYGNKGTRVKLVSNIDQDTGEAYAAYAPEYSLPEVKVTGSKNDITNPEGLKNWSRENDPITYAVRKGTDEFADKVNLFADMLPGYGDVKDFMYLSNAIRNKDWNTIGIAAGAAALPFATYGMYKGGRRLLREGIYSSVNPVAYGVKEKLKQAPTEFIRNITSNPTERAYRIGSGMVKNMKGPDFDVPLSYKEAKKLKSTILKNLDSGFYKNHKYIDGKKAEDIALRQLGDIEQSLLFGKQRLDAWNLGMRGKQDFNTLQKVEEGVYRMNPHTMRPSDASFARLSEIEKNYRFNKNPTGLTNISAFDASMKSHKKVLDAMTTGYINPLDKAGINRKRFDYLRRHFKNDPYNFTAASPEEHLEDLGNSLRFHKHGDHRALRGNYTTDVYPMDQRTGLQKIVEEDVWDIQPFQSKQNLPKFIRDIDILNTFGKGNFKLRNTYEVSPLKNYSLINAYRYGGNFKQ